MPGSVCGGRVTALSTATAVRRRGGAKVSYKAFVYKVMIASPSDVESERGIIRQVVHEWNNVNSEDKRIVLMPVGWETHAAPSMQGGPQDVINRQVLEDADLLVAAFWTRLGTPTGGAPSGTVKEIEEHLAAGKPAMIYFSAAPVRLDSVDENQYKALKDFKAKCKKRGLIEFYETLSEFREKFSRQLAITVLKEFVADSADRDRDQADLQNAEVRASPIPNLTEEAKRLLLEAAEDANGLILKVRAASGLTVQTNGKNLVEARNPRSEALWERAVDQLRVEGLISDRGHKGEGFQVTADGYAIADHLSAKA
jgi:hypothetical protein